MTGCDYVYFHFQRGVPPVDQERYSGHGDRGVSLSAAPGTLTCDDRNCGRDISQMWKSMRCVATLLFVGAGAAAQTSPSGLIDEGEFKEREDCLYREVGWMIKIHGTSAAALDDIAKVAVQFCSQAVLARLLRVSPSITRGAELARYDRIQSERRALAIGKELAAKVAP
jgi:hypothetical protein